MTNKEKCQQNIKKAILNRFKKHIGSVNSFMGNEGINHLPILIDELTNYFYQKIYDDKQTKTSKKI